MPLILNKNTIIKKERTGVTIHMIGQIILQIVLIAMNAIFACAEIAVISSNETRIAKMAEQGSKKAQRLQKMQSVPHNSLPLFRLPLPFPAFWAVPSQQTTSQKHWSACCSLGACRFRQPLCRRFPSFSSPFCFPSSHLFSANSFQNGLPCEKQKRLHLAFPT